MRLLSAASALVTLGAVWGAARFLWPGRPLLAVAAGAAALLAPGSLYVLASMGNDPLAVGLASVALLAGLHLCAEARPGRVWWVWWLVASLAAVGTKASTAPVVGAAALVVLWHHRRPVLDRVGRRPLLALAGAGLLAVLAGNLLLLTRPPSSSGLASIAHFWPVALARAPVVYARGGLAETFRTLWYGYDYAVRLAPRLEGSLAALALLLCLGAVGGLVAWPSSRRRPPALLWVAAGAQVLLVVARFGFGDLLQIETGGTAQAKGFFPATLPLALLFVAGWSALAPRLGLRDDRRLTLVLLAAFFVLDWVSLAATLWQHYRWWQIGA
jgi:hypothetical protein